MRDMTAKGRNPVQRTPEHLARMRAGIRNRPNGERHWKSKLSDFQRSEIRRLYSTGAYSQQRLAEMFSVIQTTISRVVKVSA